MQLTAVSRFSGIGEFQFSGTANYNRFLKRGVYFKKVQETV